jgi:alanine dehydrogenase
MKWVNVHLANRRRGLPTVMAVIVMNDPATGFPTAVLEGRLITKLRTAAAAAVAAQALARPDSRVVGLVGCGAQADAQLLALAEVFRLSEVRVWGYRAGEAAQFCRLMRRRLPRVRLLPTARIRDCVQGVDLVVTLTPARRPLIKLSWLSPGTHLNAVGADAPGKQELDPAILRAATVVVDERKQALHGGELNVPVRRGQFRARDIHASIGEILIGKRPGRRSRAELTVFDSTGLAIHDVAVGAEVIRQARRRHLGRRVRLLAI